MRTPECAPCGHSWVSSGASGSIIGAGGIIIAVLSTVVAFQGWPDIGAAEGPGLGEIQLADGGAARKEDREAGTPRATTLPAVPVAAVSRSARPSAERAGQAPSAA